MAAPPAEAAAGPRLVRWREACWQGDFEQVVRLVAAPATLDERGLLRLLAEDARHLAARVATPDWAGQIEAILARATDEPSAPERLAYDPDAAPAGLAMIVAPFADLAGERFTSAARATVPNGLLDLDRVRTGLVHGLRRTLVALAGRTLVLELHLRRAAGGLVGDTSRRRFAAFVRHAASADGLAALATTYPVLARLMIETAERAAAAWMEMVGRLVADRKRVVDGIFDGADPGPVTDVWTPPDEEFERRTRLVLQFVGGRRVIYRPGPVEPHLCLNAVLGWLADRSPGLAAQPVAVVDGDGYGWQAWVPRRGPGGSTELYRSLGALLAVLYVLDASGVEAGDVVACDGHAVPIDGRGLFHPAVSGFGSGPVDPATAALDASVYAMGRRWWLAWSATEDGSDDPDLPSYPSLQWVDVGTDHMRLVRTRPPRTPVSVSEPASSAVVQGFRAAYQALGSASEDLIGEEGLLWSFAAGGTRVRLHPSDAYRCVLVDTTHPDVLRDAADRDRVLAQWLAPWTRHPSRRRLAPGELADLRAGVLPSFAGRADSRDLHGGDGRPVPGILARSGLVGVADKVRRLGRRDRAVQEWIIRAALATPKAPNAAAPNVAIAGPVRPADDDLDIDPRRCLRAARRLADRLERCAYRRGERIAWIGVSSSDTAGRRIGPLGVGLYDGYSGVALFLAKLAELTGRDRYAALATRTLADVPALLERPPGPAGEEPRCGPFVGITGLAYALVHVAASLGEPTMLDAVLPPAFAQAMAATDGRPDALGGLAGCVAAVHAIHAATGDRSARRLAHVWAQWLVGWPRLPRPYLEVGFAHGAAGVGWALVRHGAATGDDACVEAGLAAFRHERAHGLPAGGGWCRGAVGVGLARSEGGVRGDPEVKEDVDLAVRAVVSQGPLPDHCLCHGELGALELLRVAADSGDAETVTAYRRRARRFIGGIERYGARCGAVGGLPTPGLLTGLAGIGYGLLRLAAPDRVPSVLLLEPPVGRPDGR
jgi:type 2 lantibiotic biosynthesis protein LanM